MLFTWPIVSLAEEGHTAEQERAEQLAKSSQTHEQIEATEEKVLGHDAHQKLEVLHVATESNPITAVVGGLAFLAVFALAIGYFVTRKRSLK